MTNKTAALEKGIGSILTIWGVFILVLLIQSFSLILEAFQESQEVQHFTNLKILFFLHSNIILSIATIFAGITLIFEKRIGWILSTTMSLTISILRIIGLFNAFTVESDIKILFYIINILILLVFLILFILLIKKSFREKYKATTQTWLIMFLIITVLLIDRNLFS